MGEIEANEIDLGDYGHWDVSSIGPFNPDLFFGFVYEITHKETGKSYIGRKCFTKSRKPSKHNKSKRKESDWKTYTSSCVPLCEAINVEGKGVFHFKIILLCAGRAMLGYEEESIQRSRDVLRARFPNGERAYWNNTIGYKNFAGLEKQTKETIEKISLGNTGKIRTEEMRNNYSEAFRGKQKSAKHREGIAKSQIGKKHTEESKEKRRTAMVATFWWTDGVNNVRRHECPADGWVRGQVRKKK